MYRTVVCLALGGLVWVTLGAVRGATYYWQVSANGYLAGIVVLGTLLGLVWPGPHLGTGFLLALPGFATLVTAGPRDHPDQLWWLLTVVIAGYAAAGAHRAAVEIRRHFAGHRHGR